MNETETKFIDNNDENSGRNERVMWKKRGGERRRLKAGRERRLQLTFLSREGEIRSARRARLSYPCGPRTITYNDPQRRSTSWKLRGYH
ncbi:hypothetical protein X777_07458 [Ooceraea biroi]|uniref:Uncharacterized protein n=1 Tax=Ooceraea biroi TaxID=2015173 RepID=A0A026X5E7_OOCBI|nr:hypothetical protein X777_07458 [Ooceraea biroi]